MREGDSSHTGKVLVSIVVPTYREAENLSFLVPRITAALQDREHEIIVVDDDSNDGTDQVVADLRKEGHALRLVVRTEQRGLSSAVLRGFSEAVGVVLVCMDADLSHPPEVIPQLIQRLEPGDVEFVIGSRYVKGGTTDEEWSWFRKFNSQVATLMARPFCRAKDPLAGYFALPRAVFERGEALNPVGYKIGLELLVKCGCTRVAEAPIHFRDRQFGQSKFSFREQINYLHHLKRLADFKFGGWAQLGQFYLVGATGMAVDLLSFGLLLRAGLALPVARALAIFIAISWNFALNRRVSFSGNRFDRPIIQQYLLWLATCGAGAIISWTTAVGLTLFINFFGAHVLVAAAVGIAAGSLTNFILARHWVFARCETSA